MRIDALFADYQEGREPKGVPRCQDMSLSACGRGSKLTLLSLQLARSHELGDKVAQLV